MATVNTAADYCARFGLVRGTSWPLEPISGPGELITGFRWVLPQHTPILPIQPAFRPVDSQARASVPFGGPILCPTELVVRPSAQRAKKFWAQGSFAVLCPHWVRQQRLSSLTGQQRDPEYALVHVCFSGPLPFPSLFSVSRPRTQVDAYPGFHNLNLDHWFFRSVLYDLMVPQL